MTETTTNNFTGPFRIDDLEFTSGSKECGEIVELVSHSPVIF